MTGWNRPDIEIEIVRHAPAATRIEEIAADIEEDGPGRAGLGRSTHWPARSALTADVTIEAPRATRFEEARIVSGRVTVSHFTGDVNAKSDSGDLTGSDLAGPFGWKRCLADCRSRGRV